jgi:hypothetical protein
MSIEFWAAYAKVKDDTPCILEEKCVSLEQM